MARWSDPSLGGKYGNPGADIHLSNKSIDQIHVFASDSLGRALQSAPISELTIAIGSGTLAIKPPQISEAKFPDFEKELIPSNRIRSKFYNGKIVASGEWQFESANTRKAYFLTRALNGVYRVTVTNGELESMNQLGRTSDAKPMVQTIECNANFSQFRVDIQVGGNTTLVQNCDDPICTKIRTFFEDTTCQIFRIFINDVINKRLATFPSLIETYSSNQKINYGLQMNEPRVGNFDIQAGLEGKSVWNGNDNVPFSPAPLDFVNRNRMASFELSDYSFNTLFYQSYLQRFQYSAAELLQKSPAIKDQLSLNCTTSQSKPVRKVNRWDIHSGIGGSFKSCMGSIFNNNDSTTSNSQFASNDTGDLVYKSNQRAPSIIVYSKDYAYFDASNGFLEIFGPTNGQEQPRQLLGRAEVRVLRGDFVPKFNGANITGSIRITNLELGQSSTQSSSLGDQWLSKLGQFAQPLLTEMFNVFFDRYAQFSIPLLDGFQCASPNFMINSRSMQVDCDIRSVDPKAAP